MVRAAITLSCGLLLVACLDPDTGDVAGAADTDDDATDTAGPPPSWSCSSEGAVSVAEAAASAGASVKVGGTSSTEAPPGCDSACESPLRIGDGSGFLETAHPEDSAWGCHPGADPLCEPLYVTPEYWVWGEVAAPEGDGEPTLVVDDFCLKTTPRGLSGTYTGQLTGASGDARTWTAEIAHDGQGWRVTVVIGPGAVVTATGVEAGDGTFAFTLPELHMRDDENLEPVTFRFVSWRNSLASTAAKTPTVDALGWSLTLTRD